MATQRPVYPIQNPIYLKPESKDHPIVRRLYELATPPIGELSEQLSEWIMSRVPSGHVYGPAGFGKTTALRFWIRQLLSETHHGPLPLFLWIAGCHYRSSECMLLRELLRTIGYESGKSESRRSLLDRLVKLYAARARDAGGDYLVLIVDEAQNLHDTELQILHDLQNELGSVGFNLTVILVGSRESEHWHELGVKNRGLDLVARFAIRSARFRGIRSPAELKLVLGGYDSHLFWPEGSGVSFTKYSFPGAFDDGLRIANSALNLWRWFEDLVWNKKGCSPEMPMEFVANTIESVFRAYTDHQVRSSMVPCCDCMVRKVTAPVIPISRSPLRPRSWTLKCVTTTLPICATRVRKSGDSPILDWPTGNSTVG
jgi:hypothetical protein